MSSVKAMAVVGFAVLLFTPPAHADGNACADAYSKAQELRSKRKLISARDALRVCSQTTCPAFIVKDCTTWLDEVQSSLPSVVPVATDGQGNDLPGVRVSMDGQVLLENADGRSVEVDPGQHAFTFELTGPQAEQAPAAVKRVVVAEGEKNKRVSAIIQRPGVAVTVQPAPPPPVQYQPVQPQGVQVQPYQAYRPPTAPPVPVSIEGASDDLRVQIDSFQTNTHTACVAPCSAMVPPGMYEIGVVRGNGNPRSPQPMFIGGPGTLRARWVSRTGLKIGGAFLLAGGVIGGIALSVAAVNGSQTCDEYGDCTNGTDTGLLEAGVSVLIVGIVGGIVLLSLKSHQDVQFVPLAVPMNTGSSSGFREGAWLTGVSNPQGGALQVKF
jgi:hypothetical protein